MAQVTRSAKSGSDWTDAELLAYNISLTPTSPAVFFQSGAEPSLDHLDPAILTSPNAEDPNLSEATADYLRYLDLAAHPTQESAFTDFAAATLKLLGFNERHAIVAMRYPIPLSICGKTRDAETDVCLIYCPTTTILLVLVKDRPFFNKPKLPNTDAHVVAEAIAVFQFNNTNRLVRGQPVLEAMTIPCITMLATTPTFYLVPVTRELSDAVKTGQYPVSHTQVLKCATIAAHQMQISDGMADTEFRKLALKHFVAFKSLARSYWKQYLA